MKHRILPVTACVLVSLAAALSASAQFRAFDGYDANTLARNDDASTGLVNLGFDVNFFGTTYSGLYVNNNGNLTFDAPLGTFTPFSLMTTNRAILAPFFADVDTRGSDSGVVTYGAGTLGGHNAFAANFFNVAAYSMQPVYNSFQVVLIDRSDLGLGYFDFEFNYGQIHWDTGAASGTNSARVGFSNGSDAAFELSGSAVPGAFFDSNLSTGLIHNQLGVAFDGTSMDGRYAFSVRSGDVSIGELGQFTPVPEPSTYGAIGALALLGLVSIRRLRSRRA